MESSIREATHAGSWYSSDPQVLSEQLGSYLSKATKHKSASNLKSIIAPHAGYSYSGPTAAFAFININPDNYDRVVVLGPSHHEYFKGCGLSPFKEAQTPFGNIPIDIVLNAKLEKKSLFKTISAKVDESEHSIEMELPFLKMIFNTKQFTLLPIMIGEINLQEAQEIGNTLLEIYEDPKTLFVISSDFCHWGKRFGYTYYDKAFNEIWQSTENLDKMALEIIGKLNPVELNEYFSKYKNTICGRKPISIVLFVIDEYQKKNKGKSVSFECAGYSQSDQVTSMNGSSVSYAAGINFII